MFPIVTMLVLQVTKFLCKPHILVGFVLLGYYYRKFLMTALMRGLEAIAQWVIRKLVLSLVIGAVWSCICWFIATWLWCSMLLSWTDSVKALADWLSITFEPTSQAQCMQNAAWSMLTGAWHALAGASHALLALW